MRKKINKKAIENDNSTLSILLKKFNYDKLIKLEDVCEDFFGLNYDTAKKRANKYALPVPAFKIGKSQKLPFVIDIGDLAQHIEKTTVKAHKEWEKFQGYCNDLDIE